MPERERLIRAVMDRQRDDEIVALFPNRTRLAIKSYRARLVCEGALPRIGNVHCRRPAEVTQSFVNAVQRGATTQELALRFGRSVSVIQHWKKGLGLARPKGTRWNADEDDRLFEAWLTGGIRNIDRTTFPGRSVLAIDKRLHRLITRGLLDPSKHQRIVQSLQAQAGSPWRPRHQAVASDAC